MPFTAGITAPGKDASALFQLPKASAGSHASGEMPGMQGLTGERMQGGEEGRDYLNVLSTYAWLILQKPDPYEKEWPSGRGVCLYKSCHGNCE